MKSNTRFMMHKEERLIFSCIFHGQHSLFAYIQFLMWPKPQFFRELHTTQIHQYFCYL